MAKRKIRSEIAPKIRRECIINIWRKCRCDFQIELATKRTGSARNLHSIAWCASMGNSQSSGATTWMA